MAKPIEKRITKRAEIIKALPYYAQDQVVNILRSYRKRAVNYHEYETRNTTDKFMGDNHQCSVIAIIYPFDCDSVYFGLVGEILRYRKPTVTPFNGMVLVSLDEATQEIDVFYVKKVKHTLKVEDSNGSGGKGHLEPTGSTIW